MSGIRVLVMESKEEQGLYGSRALMQNMRPYRHLVPLSEFSLPQALIPVVPASNHILPNIARISSWIAPLSL